MTEEEKVYVDTHLQEEIDMEEPEGLKRPVTLEKELFTEVSEEEPEPVDLSLLNTQIKISKTPGTSSVNKKKADKKSFPYFIYHSDIHEYLAKRNIETKNLSPIQLKLLWLLAECERIIDSDFCVMLASTFKEFDLQLAREYLKVLPKMFYNRLVYNCQYHPDLENNVFPYIEQILI